MTEKSPPGPTDGPSSKEIATSEKFEKSSSTNSVDPVTADKPKDAAGLGSYWRIFTFCNRVDVFLYAIAIIGSVVSGATLPLMAIVFGSFAASFNDFSTSADSAAQQFRQQTYQFVLYYVYLFVGRFVVTYVATLAASIAGIRTTRTVRKKFLECTLRQEVNHFDNISDNGSISAQVTTNGNRINQGIAEKLVILIQGIAMFFSGFIVALAESWKLALINMSVLPVIIILCVIVLALEAKLEGRVSQLHSQAGVLAQEALSSVRTIHAFWAHDKMIKSYDELQLRALKAGSKRTINSGLGGSIFQFCLFAGTALAFWEGFRLYQSGDIASVGNVLAVVMAITSGITSIATVPPHLTAIANAAAAASELFAIIDKTSELDSLSESGEKPSESVGNIEVRNLDFAYPSRPAAKVLEGLNLSFPAGKTTALVGPSGCGKSTVVALLERWYNPQSGSISLDGQDFADYNLKWLRSRIRLVQQEPVLFRGTIFENVTKGLIDEQRLLSGEEQMNLVQIACKQSNAHDFVTALPEGYHTQVGERASMLSGGQKQRIAIARSIISDPQILLLDEATSALDTRAEGIVQDALNKASRNKTTVVIAHKLSTIQHADNIIVMAQGKVVEQGTHSDLLAADGQYAALVKAQNLNSDDQQNDSGEHEGTSKTASDKLVADEKAKSSEADLSPETDESKETLNYSLLRCLWILLSEQRDLYWLFALLVVSCLIGGGVYPAQAFLFSRLINVFTLTGQEAVDSANFYALMFFVFALANLVAYGLLGGAGTRVAQSVTCRYRMELFRRILYLDQSFYDLPHNSSGALTSRLSSVPDAVMELLSQNIEIIAICIINLLASCSLAIAFGWKLGLVVVFTGIPIFVVSGIARFRLESKFEKDNNERFADSAALATEAVTNIRTVASLTLEGVIRDEYNGSLDEIARRSYSAFWFTSAAYALAQSLDFLLMALGFWYGSQLIASGEYTVSQFYVVFLSVLFGGQAAGQFFGFIPSMTRAQLAANYILWLRTQRAAIGEHEQNKDVGPEGDGAFGLDDVHFRYKGREASPVLTGISLNIPPGTHAAVVGPSGCGKSTLISLLERFYDPTSGSISLGPTPISRMSPRLYRSHISLVQQEPTLYSGSVRENITLGLSTTDAIPDSRILEACRAAHAFDFVTSLPDGLSTPCGNKGQQFSGGQRQRIAIARALIREPRVLLLDEATSALDTQSERVVQRSLDEAASGRTTVAVAHRLSTIRHADVIFVFEDGRVLESGRHEELVGRKGRYWEMCVAQAVGEGS